MKLDLVLGLIILPEDQLVLDPVKDDLMELPFFKRIYWEIKLSRDKNIPWLVILKYIFVRFILKNDDDWIYIIGKYYGCEVKK
jgi:hypothetical protein